MPFLLNSNNVFSYLVQEKLCDETEIASATVELKPAKNFNLLLALKSGKKLLVKQERQLQDGKTAGEFLNEWRVQEFLNQSSEAHKVQDIFPEILHFDRDNSILVFNYLDDYQDLSEFYTQEQVFPEAIASKIGLALAAVHRLTYHSDCRDFWKSPLHDASQIPVYLKSLERIGPEIFGIFPIDGLKFLALYQRYESLGQAISGLASTYSPCCLVHNDLKLNNLLLHNNWAESSSPLTPEVILRIIDWERSDWGDPAFDLGTLVASYVSLWLSSLVISKDIAIEESLRMAMTPLEVLQPSLRAFAKSYLNGFPDILQRQPHFMQQVIQFTGLALIQQIQAMIQYQKLFNNIGICMLQVAKSCLCQPESSMSTIFGLSEFELVDGIQFQSLSV